MSLDLESEARITFESLTEEDKAFYYTDFREELKNRPSLSGTLTSFEGWILREWARNNGYTIDYSYPSSFFVSKPQ